MNSDMVSFAVQYSAGADSLQVVGCRTLQLVLPAFVPKTWDYGGGLDTGCIGKCLNRDGQDERMRRMKEKARMWKRNGCCFYPAHPDNPGYASTLLSTGPDSDNVIDNGRIDSKSRKINVNCSGGTPPHCQHLLQTIYRRIK